MNYRGVNYFSSFKITQVLIGKRKNGEKQSKSMKWKWFWDNEKTILRHCKPVL